MRFLRKILVTALLLIGAAITLPGGSAGFLLGGSAAWAAEGAGRTPVPHPPHGKGDHCVMPTEFMRRNHMLMMYAHRKDVLAEGIRTTQFNIVGLRHLPRGQGRGRPARVLSTTRSISAAPATAMRRCRSIVSNAIIRKPQSSDKSAALGADRADAAKMAAFLRETKK